MFAFLREIALSVGMDEQTASFYARRIVKFLNKTGEDLESLPTYDQSEFAKEFKAATGTESDIWDFEILQTAQAA